MALIFNITFVTDDVHRLGRFWQTATGAVAVEWRDGLVRLRSTSVGSPDLLLLHSAAPSSAPGRIHLDLAAEVVDDEVRRLVALGATLADGGSADEPVARSANGVAWIVLLDPDGNELCLGGLPTSPA